MGSGASTAAPPVPIAVVVRAGPGTVLGDALLAALKARRVPLSDPALPAPQRDALVPKATVVLALIDAAFAESKDCHKTVMLALSKGRPVVPIVLQQPTPPLPKALKNQLAEIPTVDMSDESEFDQRFENLLDRLVQFPLRDWSLIEQNGDDASSTAGPTDDLAAIMKDMRKAGSQSQGKARKDLYQLSRVALDRMPIACDLMDP